MLGRNTRIWATSTWPWASEGKTPT